VIDIDVINNMIIFRK